MSGGGQIGNSDNIAQPVFQNGNLLGAGNFPAPPPTNRSIEEYTKHSWDRIFAGWKGGYPSDTEFQSLEDYLEYERQEIVNGKKPPIYDWLTDWHKAKVLHDINVDYVRNTNRRIGDIRELWGEWARDSKAHLSNLSIEALKAMILLNGAAIIAAFSVISGEVGSAPDDVLRVAKITIITSTISLVMIATGHALVARRLEDIVGQVRGNLLGNMRHRRVYALGRYLRRYISPIAVRANYFIYGSIMLFACSALINAFTLIL